MKYNEIKTQKARLAYIRQKIETDVRWLVNALLRVYEFNFVVDNECQ